MYWRVWTHQPAYCIGSLLCSNAPGAANPPQITPGCLCPSVPTLIYSPLVWRRGSTRHALRACANGLTPLVPLWLAMAGFPVRRPRFLGDSYKNGWTVAPVHTYQLIAPPCIHKSDTVRHSFFKVHTAHWFSSACCWWACHVGDSARRRSYVGNGTARGIHPDIPPGSGCQRCVLLTVQS